MTQGNFVETNDWALTAVRDASGSYSPVYSGVWGNRAASRHAYTFDSERSSAVVHIEGKVPSSFSNNAYEMMGVFSSVITEADGDNALTDAVGADCRGIAQNTNSGRVWGNYSWVEVVDDGSSAQLIGHEMGLRHNDVDTPDTPDRVNQKIGQKIIAVDYGSGPSHVTAAHHLTGPGEGNFIWGYYVSSNAVGANTRGLFRSPNGVPIIVAQNTGGGEDTILEYDNGNTVRLGPDAFASKAMMVDEGYANFGLKLLMVDGPDTAKNGFRQIMTPN